MSSTTITATTRDASEDLHDPEQREALEQAERLIHEILTGGGEGKAGEGNAGAFVFAAPTQVIVAGQPVSPDDPRALEAMSTAAAKLREHGLDELAAELEARAGATPVAAPPAAPPPALAARGEDAQPLPASAAETIDSSSNASAHDLAPAPDAPADDLTAAPDAPAPPEPPAPPS